MKYKLFFALVAMLALAGCVGTRNDFPAWLFPHPPQVSTEAGSNDSDMPAIYSDYGENVVIAWSSDSTANPGGSDSEIYWRRDNALGMPQTAPIRLTNNSFGDYYPSVSMSAGISYLVWMGDEISSSNIYWAAVDQDGNFVAGPQLISDPTYNDYDPHIIQCGNYSVVYWSGDYASNDYGSTTPKIRYNGIIDIPNRTLTNIAFPEDSPHGEVNILCTRLYIAYQLDFSPTDSDVYLLGIDTNDGSNVFGPLPVAATTADENEIDIAVNSPFLGTSLISVVWNADDGAGGEIYYASRYSDGSVCSPATAVTDDSQFGARRSSKMPSGMAPNMRWFSGSGSGWHRSDRDIYMKLLDDDCTPSPSASATLVSEAASSGTSEDVYPQVLARAAPDGVPIFAVVWRTMTDGAVWSRFGSLSGPIGPSDLISDSSSAGYPGGERPAPVIVQGQQLYVTWIGNNLGTAETWYQQTAWRSLLPVVLK
jgi:hypothetical protein